MPRPRPLNRPNARKGAAAVELAILLPFLCFAFVIAIDFGRIFYFSMTVTNCARNGAAYGYADSAHAVDQSGIAAVAQQDAGNLDGSQLQISSTTDNSASPNYVTVTATYPFTTLTDYPGVPNQVTLTRTVRIAVLPKTPNFN
jgi:Flp pilus assembly protein TadG